MNDWENASEALHASCRDAFGAPVIFTPAGGIPTTIIGIFEEARDVASVDAVGIPVASRKPVLEARMADFPSTPQAGDGVSVDGDGYSIVDVQPDGHGWVALIFKKHYERICSPYPVGASHRAPIAPIATRSSS